MAIQGGRGGGIHDHAWTKEYAIAVPSSEELSRLFRMTFVFGNSNPPQTPQK